MWEVVVANLWGLKTGFDDPGWWVLLWSPWWRCGEARQVQVGKLGKASGSYLIALRHWMFAVRRALLW